MSIDIDKGFKKKRNAKKAVPGMKCTTDRTVTARKSKSKKRQKCRKTLEFCQSN